MVANEIATKDDLENVVQKLRSVIANEIKKNWEYAKRIEELESTPTEDSSATEKEGM